METKKRVVKKTTPKTKKVLQDIKAPKKGLESLPKNTISLQEYEEYEQKRKESFYFMLWEEIANDAKQIKIARNYKKHFNLLLVFTITVVIFGLIGQLTTNTPITATITMICGLIIGSNLNSLYEKSIPNIKKDQTIK